jgi:hypothetical protein
MKLKRTTCFSIVLLLVFLAAVGANAYQSNLIFSCKNSMACVKAVTVSDDSRTSPIQNEFTCEETENDLADGFDTQVYFLLFFVFILRLAAVPIRQISAGLLAKSQIKPIYISGCNFRI